MTMYVQKPPEFSEEMCWISSLACFPFVVTFSGNSPPTFSQETTNVPTTQAAKVSRMITFDGGWIIESNFRYSFLPKMKRYVMRIQKYDEVQRKYVPDRVVNASSYSVDVSMEDSVYYLINYESYDMEGRHHIYYEILYRKNYHGKHIIESGRRTLQNEIESLHARVFPFFFPCKSFSVLLLPSG